MRGESQLGRGWRVRDGGWDRESKVKLAKMAIRKKSTLDMKLRNLRRKISDIFYFICLYQI